MLLPNPRHKRLMGICTHIWSADLPDSGHNSAPVLRHILAPVSVTALPATNNIGSTAPREEVGCWTVSNSRFADKLNRICNFLYRTQLHFQAATFSSCSRTKLLVDSVDHAIIQDRLWWLTPDSKTPGPRQWAIYQLYDVLIVWRWQDRSSLALV